MIKINNVSKYYGSKQTLNDISLDIKQGSITAFIGANGAGKSTLLGILSRLDSKYHGSIELDGRNLNEYKQADLALKLAFLKQNNVINTKITVSELISFGRYPHSLGNLKNNDYEKINQAIEYLELEDIKDKYIDEISGGQRQRALIAMVVAQDSDYILLDEPLNNLDMYHSTRIMKILKRLCDELDKTIIIVIHDINYTSAYADEIIAFKNGEVIHCGCCCEVINKEVLKEVFGFEFNIIEDDAIKFCQYYQ